MIPSKPLSPPAIADYLNASLPADLSAATARAWSSILAFTIAEGEWSITWRPACLPVWAHITPAEADAALDDLSALGAIATWHAGEGPSGDALMRIVVQPVDRWRKAAILRTATPAMLRTLAALDSRGARE